MIPDRNPPDRGCRTTPRRALSSRTSGIFRPESCRLIRTFDHVPGADWGLTRSRGGLCDSLRYVVFGPGSWKPGLTGPEATTAQHSRNPVPQRRQPRGKATGYSAAGPRVMLIMLEQRSRNESCGWCGGSRPRSGACWRLSGSGQAWLGFWAVRNCSAPHRGGFFAYMVEDFPR